MAKKRSKLQQSKSKKSSAKAKEERVIELSDDDVSEAELNRQNGNSNSYDVALEAEAFELAPEFFQARENLRTELQALTCYINPFTGELICRETSSPQTEASFAFASETGSIAVSTSNARSFMGVTSSGIDPFGSLYGSYLKGEEDDISDRFDLESDGECLCAVGVGYKTQRGVPTGELALKVYIDRKAMRTSPLTSKLVPTEIEGKPVDLEEIGGDLIPMARYELTSQKAVSSRFSICNYEAGKRAGQRASGTLGCLVELNDGRLCLLSNHHVLSPAGQARDQDHIIKTGSCGSAAGIQLLGLYTNSREKNGSFSAEGRGVYQADAAVAFTSFDKIKSEYRNLDFDPEPIKPELGMTVIKNGSATGPSMGIITGVGVQTSIMYPGTGRVSYTGQIMIQGINNSAFSMPGDAGSLICCARTRRPVALLFAGSVKGSFTLANPIQTVMREVGIKRLIS